MSTELPEPADSSTSDQVTGAEMRMQQALADICNGISWSNDKQLARQYGVTRKITGTGCEKAGYPSPRNSHQGVPAGQMRR